MAHEALLQTELNSGSRAFVTMPRHSSSTGSSEAWHAWGRFGMGGDECKSGDAVIVPVRNCGVAGSELLRTRGGR